MGNFLLPRKPKTLAPTRSKNEGDFIGLGIDDDETI